MARGDKHEDRGDGVCIVCYVDAPCAMDGRDSWFKSGVDAWEAEERNRFYERREAEREARLATIRAALARLAGVDELTEDQVSSGWSSQLIEIRIDIDVIDKIVANIEEMAG